MTYDPNRIERIVNGSKNYDSSQSWVGAAAAMALAVTVGVGALVYGYNKNHAAEADKIARMASAPKIEYNVGSFEENGVKETIDGYCHAEDGVGSNNAMACRRLILRMNPDLKKNGLKEGQKIILPDIDGDGIVGAR